MTAKTRRCSSPPNKMHPKGTSVPYPTPSKSFGGGILSVRGGVGDKDYIFLNTKGICLLCYDECDPVTNDEKRRVHTQTTINFCRLISRYLNFSMENVIANSLKTVGKRGVEDKKKFDNVAFELCERCVGLAHAFNQVHFQVQFHQMILDRCVRSISDIIKKANKKSVNELFVLSEDEEAMKNQKKTFTRLTMGGFQSANRLRTKLYTRSMTKLSSSFPIIKLKRICKSGDWIQHLKKGKNQEKSKVVPASPPVVRYSVNSREVHLLASYLGCIVSFWLVISMSFINLDELVINIKKEKLIELKLERDIGVDVDNIPFRPQTKRSPLKNVEETPKKKRNYSKKKAQTDESTNEEAKQEPKKRGRKRKVKVMPNNEMKPEVASSACSVKNPPQNVQQVNQYESPKKAFVMSKSPSGVTILTKPIPKSEAQFPSCNNTNHLQALEKVQVPAATTASALPTWQPVKPVPVQATPQPYLAPMPPTQFPGQYAQAQQPSQSQSIQPTASSSSTYQYNYPSTSTQPQSTYIPQSQQYYSPAPAVPSSSSNYQQPNSYQAYQAPVAPAPITQQRRSSAASTTYDCFAYNNSESTPNSYSNYNYKALCTKKLLL